MNCRLTIGLALVLSLASSHSLAAADGASLYKSKCAGCHGVNGEGKPTMKAPTLKGTTLEVGQLVQHLTKGEPSSKAPHNKGRAGLTDEQAKAIAEYVQSLKQVDLRNARHKAASIFRDRVRVCAPLLAKGLFDGRKFT